MLGYSVKIVILILFPFLFMGCDDCRDIACTTPPNGLTFVIKDVEIKDHIRNIYGPQVVTIEDSNGEFLDITVQDQYIYYCNSIAWQTGIDKKSYILHVGDKSYPFIYHTENRTENCCELIGYLIDIDSDAFIINEFDNKDPFLINAYIDYEFLIDY